ncbi:MAG TPA: hypothetical protein PKD72_16015 [Gemmatales bacterium]|nr:hypothetical protein [Gemmatales bacterium]
MEMHNMFSGGVMGMIQAALLIGLFWAALAHPDRIRSIFLFRTAALLVGISIVIPVMVQLFIFGSPLASKRAFGTDVGLGMYAMALSPLCTMLAIVLGLGSVTPIRRER